LTEGNDPLLAFLDGDVLARPVTRTLVLRAAAPTGRSVGWSQLAEDQGNRNQPAAAVSVTSVRELLKRDLGPTGTNAERFAQTSASDRQVLADAVAAGAGYIVTSDVDDFAEADLLACSITAVNPDLYLSITLTSEAYVRLIDALARTRRNPPQTPAQVHAMLGRQHPRTTARFAPLFDVPPQPPTHPEPAVTFAGRRCVKCGTVEPANRPLISALCQSCRR
jgi:hypothetical protein